MVRPSTWPGYKRPKPHHATLRCHVVVVMVDDVDGGKLDRCWVVVCKRGCSSLPRRDKAESRGYPPATSESQQRRRHRHQLHLRRGIITIEAHHEYLMDIRLTSARTPPTSTHFLIFLPIRCTILKDTGHCYTFQCSAKPLPESALLLAYSFLHTVC